MMYVRWDGPQRCWTLWTLSPSAQMVSLGESRELGLHNGTTSRPPRWFQAVRAIQGQAGGGCQGRGARLNGMPGTEAKWTTRLIG